MADWNVKSKTVKLLEETDLPLPWNKQDFLSKMQKAWTNKGKKNQQLGDIRVKNSYLLRTPLGKWKGKPQIGRRYLQCVFLIKTQSTLKPSTNSKKRADNPTEKWTGTSQREYSNGQ